MSDTPGLFHMTSRSVCTGAIGALLGASALVLAHVMAAGSDEVLLAAVAFFVPMIAISFAKSEAFIATICGWFGSSAAFGFIAASEQGKENPFLMILALTTIVALLFSALPVAAGAIVALSADRLIAKHRQSRA